MTDGERWARETLTALREAGFSPRAVAHFLAASQQRAGRRRAERPELARQAAAWLVAGALAYVPLRPRGALRWWAAVALMLDWHLGMFESEDGRPRPLGPADACTLARAWLVPLVAQERRRALCAVGFATDVADGALARAGTPTRAGRDLEGLVDAAFVVAALRGSAVPRAAAVTEAARVAAGVALTTVSYLRGTPRRVPPSRPAAALRALALLAPAPRPAAALSLAASAVAVRSHVRG